MIGDNHHSAEDKVLDESDILEYCVLHRYYMISTSVPTTSYFLISQHWRPWHYKRLYIFVRPVYFWVLSEYVSPAGVGHSVWWRVIHIYTPIPGVSGGNGPAAPRGRPPCLPLECMTGMTPPHFPGLSPLLTRPVCTGANPARTLHTYNVVVSIPSADQKGSQGGWLVRLNRSH